MHGLVAGDRRLVDDRAAFRDFFAILPHVVLDDELRERVAALYDWYRDLYVGGPRRRRPRSRRQRLRRFASLMVAMTDGLAVQKLLDPDGVELEPLFGLWESMLAGAAPGRTEASARRRPSSRRPPQAHLQRPGRVVGSPACAVPHGGLRRPPASTGLFVGGMWLWRRGP